MLYLYDSAIVDDLNQSFNPDLDNPVVKVVDPEQVIGLVAQIKKDEIKFPIISLKRNDPVIDESRYNFRWAKNGVPCVIDIDKNNIYNERSIPMTLSYVLTVLTTNQVDMDEIMRELIFKYESMYFLEIKVPYESKREISFGIVINKEEGIESQSGSSQYTENGQLYQSSIQLDCQGCVLLHYTPRHVKRLSVEVEPE